MTAKQKIEALTKELDLERLAVEDLKEQLAAAKAESERLAVKLQDEGIEDDGAAAIALPQSRMLQLVDAVRTLEKQKALVMSNGSPPPPCNEDGRTVVLESKEYERARDILARYERTYGNLGGQDLSSEARAFR